MTKEERDKLIEDNINLVYYVVNQYYKPNNLSGMDKEDFYSEGFIGLIKAADSYNPDTDCKFSTYAYKGICFAISKIYRTENYVCRKANHGAMSIEYDITGGNNYTLEDIIGVDEDMTYIESKEILEFIDSLNIKSIKFILNKLSEGYNQYEIAKMLGVSRSCVNQAVRRLRKKLRKSKVI